MNQERDTRVGQEMVCLARCGVGGHDNGRVGVKGGGRKVGIGHQRDMRREIVACCQMQLMESQYGRRIVG